jgi:predicted enzyme related to lactoylglutathione lyase
VIGAPSASKLSTTASGGGAGGGGAEGGRGVLSGSQREEFMFDVPRIFRVMIEVGNLDEAAAFYSELLGMQGRDIERASRRYYDCGGVLLAVVDVSRGKQMPRPNATEVYFSVSDLEGVYARAKALQCLSKGDVHAEPGGEIVVRPWRERSFYAFDPWDNGLCFVDGTTLFTGK